MTISYHPHTCTSLSSLLSSFLPPCHTDDDDDGDDDDEYDDDDWSFDLNEEEDDEEEEDELGEEDFMPELEGMGLDGMGDPLDPNGGTPTAPFP